MELGRSQSGSSDEKQGGLRRFLEAGGAVVGAGLGSSAAFVSGDPLAAVVGAVGGQAIASAIGEVLHRTMTHRENVRVEVAADYAVRRLAQFANDGVLPRSDGFFAAGSTDRSAGDETVEGVLIAAQRSFEERKVPHLGSLLAYIAVTATIDPTTANSLVSEAQSLSWLDYRLLAAYGRPSEVHLPRGNYSTQRSGSLESITIMRSMVDLRDGRLLMATTGSPGRLGESLVSDALLDQQLALRGRLLFEGLNLESIPVADVQEILDRIEAD